MASTLINEPAFRAADAARLTKTDLTRCSLVMNIGPHQLAFALVDPQDQSFLSVKGYFFDTGAPGYSLIEILEQCFDQNKMLFTAFERIRISFDTPVFTILPAAHYDPLLKREYLNLLHPELPGSLLLADTLPSDIGAVNVFAADKNVPGYLKKEFPSARFYHADTAFLLSVTRTAPPEGHHAYIRVLTDSMVLTVLEGSRLLIMQNYPVSSGADALYHLANALTQLGLPPKSTAVFLSGEIQEDAPLYLDLMQGIANISWLGRPPDFRFGSAFADYPSHYFYQLTSLALCE